MSTADNRQQTVIHMKYKTLNTFFFHYFLLSFNWKQKNVERVLFLFFIFYSLSLLSIHFSKWMQSNSIRWNKKLRKKVLRRNWELNNFHTIIIVVVAYSLPFLFYDMKMLLLTIYLTRAIECNHTSLNDVQSYQECMIMHLVNVP